MRAIGFDTFGDPAAVLRVRDVPLPEPGPGEVRLRITLSPIHNHDHLTVRGLYGVKPALPAIGGSEAVGIIDALGPDVDGLPIGARVASAAIRGAWADYALAPAATTVMVADDVPDHAAAQMLGMPLSALMLLDDLGLAAGDWLLQTAATGAVARVVEAIAAARGINVINLVRRADAVAALQAAGAAHVLSTTDPDWADGVRARTGTGVHAVIDAVAGDGTAALIRLIRPRGQLVMFGALSGAPFQLRASDLIFREITMRGFWATAAVARTSPPAYQAMAAEIAAMVRTGAIALPAEPPFGFDALAAALLAHGRAGRAGKVMFRP